MPDSQPQLTLSPVLRRWLARADSRAAWRAMLGLFGILLLIYCAVPIANAVLKSSFKDYELWHDTGQHVLRGEPIYPARFHKFPFMYPPTAAVLLAPISLLGKTGVVVTLLLVNVAAWCASIVLAVRLATGSWKRQHLLLYLVPSVVIAVYAWSNFHLGQPSLLLLALMLGGFTALQKNRQVLAGALLAFAASIKAFPVVAIVYLVYRRYWTAVAALVLALVFLLLVLPAPFRGVTQARDDLQRWTEGMLLKYDDKGLAQRPGRSNSWKNQSFFGVANRTLRHIDADEQFGKHTPLYVNLADLSFQAVNTIIASCALLLGLAYVAAMPRRDRRTKESDALEFALFILLLLMFTPLAFGYLFACLLYPFTVLVQRLLEHPTRRLLLCGAVSISLLALALPLQRSAQAYGNTFFATLVLFIGLAIELWNRKRVAVSA